MRTKLLALLVALAMTPQLVKAQTAIAVTVHLFPGSAGYSDQTLQDVICDINSHYNEGIVNTGMHFYLHNIIRNTKSPISYQDAVNISPKGPQVNIYGFYTGNGTAAYNSSTDAIFTSAFSGSVLTHEIGHFFGLNHPDFPGPGAGHNNPGCNCNPGGGDPDCIPDTTPPGVPTGNYMDDGGGNHFTNGQKSWLLGCVAAKGWTSPGNFQAVHQNYHNIIPMAILDANSGTISWSASSIVGCDGNTITSVDVLVRTQAQWGCEEHAQFYQFGGISSPVGISTIYGITSIEFTYHYWGGATNKIIKYYNVPAPLPFPCTWNPPASYKKSTGISHVEESTMLFKLLNNISPDKIKIENTGYINASVYDISGKEISNLDLQNGESTLDISNWAQGVYIIKAIAPGRATQVKFAKQ